MIFGNIPIYVNIGYLINHHIKVIYNNDVERSGLEEAVELPYKIQYNTLLRRFL